LTPTNSHSVELFVFTFALLRLKWEILYPMSVHHLYAHALDTQQMKHQRTTSTAHHYRHLKQEVDHDRPSGTPSDDIASPNQVAGALTLVVRNAIAKHVSSLALLVT
jgi:hypothetical protein